MGIGGPGKYSMPLGPGTGPGPALHTRLRRRHPVRPRGRGLQPVRGQPAHRRPGPIPHRRPRPEPPGRGPPVRPYPGRARVASRARAPAPAPRRRPRRAVSDPPPVLALHPKTLNVHARARGARETRTLAAASAPSAVAGGTFQWRRRPRWARGNHPRSPSRRARATRDLRAITRTIPRDPRDPRLSAFASLARPAADSDGPATRRRRGALRRLRAWRRRRVRPLREPAPTSPRPARRLPKAAAPGDVGETGEGVAGPEPVAVEKIGEQLIVAAIPRRDTVASTSVNGPTGRRSCVLAMVFAAWMLRSQSWHRYAWEWGVDIGCEASGWARSGGPKVDVARGAADPERGGPEERARRRARGQTRRAAVRVRESGGDIGSHLILRSTRTRAWARPRTSRTGTPAGASR